MSEFEKQSQPTPEEPAQQEPQTESEVKSDGAVTPESSIEAEASDWSREQANESDVQAGLPKADAGLFSDLEMEMSDDVDAIDELVGTLPEAEPPAPAPKPVEELPPLLSHVVEIDPLDQPQDHKKSKKGLVTFIVCVAVTVALALSCTVGYFIGVGQSRRSSVVMGLEPKPQDTDALSAEQVYAQVNPSIVGIAVYNDSASAVASGVIYTEDGYVITNDHIYADITSPKFLVFTFDGKSYEATYVAGDTRSDLAVLKINGSGFQPATFGNSEELVVGESVVAIGRPSGATTDSNITKGIISLLNRRVSVTTSYSASFIQTDTAINPGSSGGALVNMYGQVVGITSSKLVGNEYDRIGFAIPTKTVKRVVDSLIQNGYVADRARLGITYREVDAVTAKVNNIPQGIMVASVENDSDLYGKVQENDIITEVNGIKLDRAAIILDIIEELKPGDTITVTVQSGNQTFSATARLLADAGSSSYQESSGNIGGNGSDGTSSYNSSDFDFPFGY